jgi:hypothetical protein
VEGEADDGILPPRRRRRRQPARSPEPGGDAPLGTPAPAEVAGAGPEPDGSMPPPPPPAPPPEPLRRGKPRHRNEQWSFPPYGYIIHNLEGKRLDAHCDHDDHKDEPKNACRFGRSYTTDSTGRPTPQGRPLGYLIAWLMLGGTKRNRGHHCDMTKARFQTPSDLEQLSFDVRAAARAQFADKPEYAALFGLERRPRIGEGPEPQGLC